MLEDIIYRKQPMVIGQTDKYVYLTNTVGGTYKLLQVHVLCHSVFTIPCQQARRSGLSPMPMTSFVPNKHTDRLCWLAETCKILLLLLSGWPILDGVA